MSNSANNGPLVLFYSYSHKDETMCQELINHLESLRLSGLIEGWHDRKIMPGDDWEKEISQYLEEARVILLLISSDFLASRYAYEIEAARALERHREGTARVIPVILRPSKWDITPFGKLQALPDGALAVTEWPNKDNAYLSIVEGILKIALERDEPDEDPRLPRGLTSKSNGGAGSASEQQRVFDAAFPKSVTVEKTVALVVLIRTIESQGLRNILRLDTSFGVGEEDVESSGSFELEFPVDEDGELSPIDVSVSVQAPDFSPPFQSKKMRVKPEGDSGPRVLFVTPKRAGNLLVNVELILDESVIASCVFSTRASAEGGGEPSAQLRSVDLGSGPAAVPDPEIDTTLGSGESPNEGPAQSTWSSSKMKRLPSVIQKSGSSDSFTFGSGTKSAMGSTIRIAAGLMIFGFVSFATYLGISEFKTAATIASTELNQPERLAVENVEKIVAAQKIFAANNPEKRFGTIEELKNAGLIDETMVDPEKGGYAINVTLKDSGNAFDVVAEPVKPKVVAISARKVFSTEKREVFLKDRKEVVTRDQPGLLLTKDK